MGALSWVRRLGRRQSTTQTDIKTAETPQPQKRHHSKRVHPIVQVRGYSGRTYDVMKVIGKGGFGEVYMATSMDSDINNSEVVNEYAIKAEQPASLEMEVQILNTMKGQLHFCTLHDQGLDPQSGHRYIVMTLLGPNLSFIRKAMPERRLTISTALRCSIQMLDAIEQLHSGGFVSRDIKPSNFAIGLPTKRRRLLYILDFGIAQRYLKDNGLPIKPMIGCAWRGTTRYCPLANHRRESPSPKDDLESWYYSSVELLLGSLPWTMFDKEAKEKACEVKEQCRGKLRSEFIGDCPREFDQMLTMIDRYSYYDRPEYEKFYVALMRCLDRYGFSFSDPYDWEYVFQPYVEMNDFPSN